MELLLSQMSDQPKPQAAQAQHSSKGDRTVSKSSKSSEGGFYQAIWAKK